MRKITTLTLDFDFSNASDVFEVHAFPGRCIHTSIKYVPRKVLLRRDDAGQHIAIGVAHVEVDTSSWPPGEIGPKQLRRFVTLQPGHVLAWPGEVEHFCSFVNPSNGALLHVYEVLSVDEAEVARRQEREQAALP